MNNLATHLKLFTVAIIWGFGWPAGRVVANDILPFTASWIRYIIATLCFLAYLKFSNLGPEWDQKTAQAIWA